MSKPIIAVDIDDVLLPHFEDLMQWFNTTYGTALTLLDNGKDDPRAWGVASGEDAIRRVQNFFESRKFREAEPFQDAKRALLQLSANYELVIVTARDTVVEETTRLWLEEHFSDLIKEVHFTNFYSLEGKTRSKGDVCRQIGASYLIDDSPGNIQAASGAGVKGILFGDYPWNQVGDLPASVTRCKSWPVVLEYFDARR